MQIPHVGTTGDAGQLHFGALQTRILTEEAVAQELEKARGRRKEVERSGESRGKVASVEAASPAASSSALGDSGRFQVVSLTPVEISKSSQTVFLPFLELEEEESPEPRRPRTALLRLVLDRTLFLTEIGCALVVAWLVGQYLYTVYFDTGPRKVSSSGRSNGQSSQVLGLTSGPTPSPTRIAEVAPPLVGPPPAGLLKDEGLRPLGDRADGKRGTSPGEDAAVSVGPPSSEPTATPDPKALPVRLRIPKMFLDSPVEEVKLNMGAWEVSSMQVGHHEGTGNPGETGNVVLAAHRDINSALFRELDRLEPGDEVFVSSGYQEYKYLVTESFVVSPDAAEVMEPTDDKRVTLITCTPIGLATQRLIVLAVLADG